MRRWSHQADERPRHLVAPHIQPVRLWTNRTVSPNEKVLIMESLFELVRPRDDVMSGELTEAKFAASLQEVAAGTAQDAYGVPETFFAGTYPSGGLRTLLNEALGRLGGGK